VKKPATAIVPISWMVTVKLVHIHRPHSTISFSCRVDYPTTTEDAIDNFLAGSLPEAFRDPDWVLDDYYVTKVDVLLPSAQTGSK
jgi:hypothetical protein